MQLAHEDWFELYALIPKYSHTLDYGDMEDMRNIWAEDCTFTVDSPAYSASGIDEVIAMLSQTRQSHPHVRHIVSNSWVRVSDTVQICSYLQILDTQSMSLTMFARYIDEVEKTAQGWRIKHRKCLNG
ncbi:nuclear transport factor 2 family protein [Parahaliea sp. F7430]|uniref:Nuclear transport factor 2 family protein n=1 Tax=Sediminihaliea albiluteola TaxID=2758564 RepID=A0A7W2YJZ9_9GAMM|nr:nuclear transport factor 2 family protein [Sediminihaliea albiluteola]MBA6413675.1 nuclear transport factor 2 family protein [Sediminihaliea albiluteola]